MNEKTYNVRFRYFTNVFNKQKRHHEEIKKITAKDQFEAEREGIQYMEKKKGQYYSIAELDSNKKFVKFWSC